MVMATMGALGGIAQYVRKVQAGRRWSVWDLIGEIVISVSAGTTAGLLVMDHASLPWALACASVAGHLGTRFIYAMSAAVIGRAKGAP